MKNLISTAAVLALCMLASSLAAEVTLTVDVPPAVWDLDGSPVPETHWSPWLMPGVQTGVRAALGVRLSKGAVSVRAPIRLSVSYDPEEAKAGRGITLRVKAEPIARQGTDLSFESAFGLFLPSRLQVGLVNIAGLGSPLPWVDLSYDLWGLLAFVPKVGDYLASLKDQIGINTSGSGPIQLGSWSEFHDRRDLISFDISEEAELDFGQDDAAASIYGSLPSSWTDKAVTIVKLVKGESDSEAADFIKEKISDGLGELLPDIFTMALSADPYYKIKGTKLGVTVTVAGPSGTGSGQYWLEFTAPGQVREIHFPQITPFVADGDVLRVWASSVIYDMEVRQGLDAIAGLAGQSINLENTEKTIAYAQAQGNFTREQGSISIPLARSDEPFLTPHAGGLGQSGLGMWASPSTPMVGTLSVYKDGILVASASETRLRVDHKILVDGLSEGQAYDFVLSGVGADGRSFVNPPLRETSLPAAKGLYRDVPTGRYGALAGLGDDPAYTATVSGVAVAPQARSAAFTWNTNVPMTSFVYLSSTSDGSLSYTWKKTQLGSFPTNSRSDFPAFETSHRVEVADLEPMTTYRYMILSEWFKDNDPASSMYFPLSQTGTFTTGKENASLVKVKVRYQGGPVAGHPVTFTGPGGFRTVLLTGTDGSTRPQFCALGGAWTFSSPALGLYKAAFLNAGTSLPPSTSASQVHERVLDLEGLPSRSGIVFDGKSGTVPGASIIVTGGMYAQTAATGPITHSTVATTDASGYFTPAATLPDGHYFYTARKAGYTDGSGEFTIETHGLARRVSCGDAICRDLAFNLTAIARDQTGNPVLGAAITLSGGTGKPQTAVTDASGSAWFVRSLGGDPAKPSMLAVSGMGPPHGKYLGGNAVVEARPTETQTLILTLPLDEDGPIVSDIAVRQTGIARLSVWARAAEPGCQSRIIVTDGGGGKWESNWMPLSDQVVDRSHTLLDARMNDPALIDLEVKDARGNLTRIPGLGYKPHSGPLWGFSLASIAETAAVLRFNPFPSAESFSHYILRTNEMQSIRIDSRTPGPVTLSGLPSNRSLDFLVTAFAKDGSTLAISPVIAGSTLSAKPTIGKAILPPAIGTGYPVTIEIPATDPDSPLRGMSLGGKGPSGFLEKATLAFSGTSRSERGLFTLSFPAAGTYILKPTARDERSETEGDFKVIVSDISRPAFSLSEVPPTALGRATRIEGLVMRPRREAEAPLQFSIDWGDGGRPEILKLEKAKDDRAISTRWGLGILGEEAVKAMDEKEEKERRDKARYPVAAEHLYAAEGEYIVTVKALVESGKAFIESEPRRMSLRVDPVLPILRVSDRMGYLAIGSNGKSFGLLVEKGSYDLGDLKVDWGDGTKELLSKTSRGAILSHYYAARGVWPVEVSIADSRGNISRFSMTVFVSRTDEPKEDRALFEANPMDPAYYKAVRLHGGIGILVAPTPVPAATPVPIAPGKTPRPMR